MCIYAISPLFAGGALPCTFIALPVYFSAGAKTEEIVDYSISAVMGLIWAAIILSGTDLMLGGGHTPALSAALFGLVISIVLCSLHMLLGPNHSIQNSDDVRRHRKRHARSGR